MSLVSELFPGCVWGRLSTEQRKTYHVEWYRRNLDSIRARNRRNLARRAARERERERNDPDYRKAKREVERRWRNENRDATALMYRRYQIKKRYGLTVADLDAMLVRQGGGCAICASTTSKNHHNRLVIDHDHHTGLVRGILCDRCNIVLGRVHDDERLLRQMIKYLRVSKGQRALRSGRLFDEREAVEVAFA